jgi:UTP--glucose-1-phosphate uridylyltransferase
MRIDEIVEKPAPEVAPSRMGVAGRYVLTPRIFDEIRNQPRAWVARSSSPMPSSA